MDRAVRKKLTAEPETDCARDCIVGSDDIFKPLFAAASHASSKFTPNQNSVCSRIINTMSNTWSRLNNKRLAEAAQN
jgi:hypothetical protein